MPASVRDRRLVVRPLKESDIPQVQALQQRCFGGLSPWDADTFRMQIKRFNEGQIVIQLDGRIVATSSSLIVREEDWDGPHSFDDISDHGRIGTHNPAGDALYGIDIAVDPQHRGLRLSRRIYDARKDLIRKRNLRHFLIAGRMPGYHKHAAKLTPEDYVKAVVEKRLKDVVITAQLSNGFVIQNVLRDYLPNDKESCGHAVNMEWLNPHYVPPGSSQWQGSVRVSSVQYQMRTITSFDEFIRQCEFFVDTAAEYHADFVLFPELLTNQLQALVTESRPGLTARRLSEFTPVFLERFNALAIKYNINIIAGTHLTVEDGHLYNIAHLFRRDGSVERQRKIHITPSEERWWGVEAGDRVEVFDTDRGRIAILICYDIEFPELVRIAVAKGADMIFVPFNTDIRSGYLRVRYCAQARCIENNIYTILSGACGNLPQVEGADVHYAQSCILTPSDVPFSRDGIAAEATPNVETMVVHDLDIGLVRRMRSTGAVRTWIDRRKDIYRLTYLSEGKPRDV